MHTLKSFLIFVKKVAGQIKEKIIGMIIFLVLCNIFIWVITFFMSMQYPVLIGLVTLAYGLGLRHAVDADHIAAIDNTTRKLMQEGQKPVAVGFFFSLGHSTIVIFLSLLIVVSANFAKANLPLLKETGGLIGTLVSSIFLFVIGIINLFVFIDIFTVWRKITKGEKYDESLVHEHLHNRGLLAKIFRPFLKTVQKSWHMYVVGLLFGLGFDTASEIGLLSISAATAVRGLPTFYILILPLAFTIGMALIDTLDGILMLGAYGWAYIKPIRKLYYNMNITFISVIIALFIGGIEAMQIIISQLKLKGNLAYTIKNLNFGNLGYIIIIIFIVCWIISLLVYKSKKYDILESTHVHIHPK